MIEVAVVLAIIGILAAVAAPSFLSWYRKQETKKALTMLESAFNEVQLTAMRNSQTCTLSIPLGLDPTITANPSTCLPAGSRKLKRVQIRSSGSFSSISYSFRGETGKFSPETLVLSHSEASQQQFCLVIDGPIGLLRTGKYSWDDTTGTDSNKCQTQQ